MKKIKALMIIDVSIMSFSLISLAVFLFVDELINVLPPIPVIITLASSSVVCLCVFIVLFKIFNMDSTRLTGSKK